MTRLEVEEKHPGLPKVIMTKDEGNMLKKPFQSATELEEVLIQAVHKRKPLWDPTVHYYRNNSIVKVLWEEVAQETGLTDSQSRTRWKSLRDYYRNELKKIKKTNSEEKKSNWIYFQPLSFLGGVMGYTKPESENPDNNDSGKISANDEDMPFDGLNYIEEPADIKKQSPELDLLKDEDNSSDEKSLRVHSPQHLDHDYSQQPRVSHNEEQGNHSVGPCESPYPHHSKRNQDPSLRGINPLKMRPNFEAINKKVLSQLESRRIDLLDRVTKQSEDDDILFFRSLIPSVKSLPKHRKMRLRLNIQELVCKEIERLKNE